MTSHFSRMPPILGDCSSMDISTALYTDLCYRNWSEPTMIRQPSYYAGLSDDGATWTNHHLGHVPLAYSSIGDPFVLGFSAGYCVLLPPCLGLVWVLGVCMPLWPIDLSLLLGTHACLTFFLLPLTPHYCGGVGPYWGLRWGMCFYSSTVWLFNEHMASTVSLWWTFL